MPVLNLPEFAAGLPATRVDASLRQALDGCDRARECAALWFAEVARVATAATSRGEKRVAPAQSGAG